MVLNLHYYETSNLESDRICRCLSLGAQVVSEAAPDQDDYPSFAGVVRFFRQGAAGEAATLLQQACATPPNDRQRMLRSQPSRFRQGFRRFLLAQGLCTYDHYANAAGTLPKSDNERYYLTLAETPDPVVLLSHTPPDGTQVAAGGMGSGAAEMDLADAVRRLPAGSLVLSGHVHHPARWHDRLGVAVCFNPGVDESAEVPCHIVIDTARCTAVFHEDEESRGPIGW